MLMAFLQTRKCLSVCKKMQDQMNFDPGKLIPTQNKIHSVFMIFYAPKQHVQYSRLSGNHVH